MLIISKRYQVDRIWIRINVNKIWSSISVDKYLRHIKLIEIGNISVLINFQDIFP